jgi:hypothetical protein
MFQVQNCLDHFRSPVCKKHEEIEAIWFNGQQEHIEGRDKLHLQVPLMVEKFSPVHHGPDSS